MHRHLKVDAQFAESFGIQYTVNDEGVYYLHLLAALV